MSKEKISVMRSVPFFMVENALIDNGDLNIHEISIFVTLCRYANNTTNECFPSLNLISEKLSISKPTVIKYLDCLIEKGYITKRKLYSSNGDYKNNVYTIKGVVKDVDNPSKGDLPPLVKEVNYPSKGGLPYKDSVINTDNKNTNKKEVEPFGIDSVEFRLASRLRNHILNNNEKASVPSEDHMRTKKGWCSHIDKMIRLDKLTEYEIEVIIDFSQTDQFWHQNILSAATLRKQKDKLILKCKNKMVQSPSTMTEKLRNAHDDVSNEWMNS